MKSFLVITFLILFSIFPLVYADTIENPVFSFQKDGVFDEESATEWAKLNSEIPEMNKATVCTWFKVYFHRYENTVWTYCIEKDSNLICNGLGNFEDKYFFFQFFSISYFSVLSELRIVLTVSGLVTRLNVSDTYKIHQWNSLCFTLQKLDL